MAPMLAAGVEELMREIGAKAPRRCGSWTRLIWDVSASDASVVLVGVEEEFDHARAHSLSVDCPHACVIACGVHSPELTVMRGGEVLVACPLTADSLRAAIAAG